MWGRERDGTSARKLLERARNLSPQNSTVTAILAMTYQMTTATSRKQDVTRRCHAR